MDQLYPLKFKPQIFDKIWGGPRLKDILGKPTKSIKAGESWEISCVEGHISVVENGELKGNSLEELAEIYMSELLGDRIFEKFGRLFPLLIKFIDANDKLSIQVHPDDELAEKRHGSFGKTEMWYVVGADPGAELITGFNRKTDRETFLGHLNNKKLTDILNTEPVKAGDVFFLPAGRVHAIGAGILLAEIQQTSDVTYRIYDFDRPDEKGNLRDLHTGLALDAIDYNYYENYRTAYTSKKDQPNPLVHCRYFTTNLLELTKPFKKDITWLDCFVIYMCLDGKGIVTSPGNEDIPIKKGETVLIPASLTHYAIQPAEDMKLLEVYVDEEE